MKTNPVLLQPVIDAFGRNSDIAANTSLAWDERNALLTLAGNLGIAKPSDVSSFDLVTLYNAARKDTNSAMRMAQRINAKHGAASLLDPTPAPVPVSTPAGNDPRLPALIRAIDTVQETLAERVAREAAMKADIERNARDAARTIAALEVSMAANVAAQVATALREQTPTVLHVTRDDTPTPVVLDVCHFETPRLILWLNERLNVYLYGPSGTGKTSAALQVAKALNVKFYMQAKVESEYLLLGFRDAMGNTIRTAFRDAYEFGGVFLFDEMDASASGAITAINGALANKFCPFPDGTIEMHPDFYCIGAGNTKMTGANHHYTGRVAIDAASINRFCFLEFGYDEKMELAITPNQAWTLRVQALRKAVADRGLDVLVTPRASIDGAKLIRIGESWERAEEATIFKGLEPDTTRQIRSAAGVL